MVAQRPLKWKGGLAGPLPAETMERQVPVVGDNQGYLESAVQTCHPRGSLSSNPGR